MDPVYATVEDVQRALDVQPSAASARQIDRALRSASRDVDGLCHRTFYPWQGVRKFDWPGSQYRPSWRLWLDEHELISLTSIVSGGLAVAPADVVLYPQAGPPYNRIETNLSTSAAWGGGDTHQQDITITGLWAGCPLVEATDGALAGAVASTTATTLTVDAATSASVGVGSVLRLDAERLLVTGRTMATTGQTLTADLGVQKNATTVSVASGTAFAVDETLLIGGERMRITDIAGNTLVVERAVDGSTLAAHTAGATIYAARTLTVTRGALGTTAATHTSAAPAYRWEPPGLVKDLTIANAMNRVLQEQAGYARTSKASSGAKSTSVEVLSLDSLRTQVYDAYGRKARHRGV
ncbi:hypothetical protein ACFWR9_08805 [Streptomyces sp. NPDC058534]|uniref:hypothetical protein n=1 Tax=Streptomyces sp. NPDC058534 TaxID=3346541 RepID=UPI0036537B42